MATLANLTTLRRHFSTGTPLTPELKKYWSSLMSIEKTSKEQSILITFKQNPSIQNQAKVAAMIKAVVARLQSKRSNIDVGFASSGARRKVLKKAVKKAAAKKVAKKAAIVTRAGSTKSPMRGDTTQKPPPPPLPMEESTPYERYVHDSGDSVDSRYIRRNGDPGGLGGGGWKPSGAAKKAAPKKAVRKVAKKAAPKKAAAKKAAPKKVAIKKAARKAAPKKAKPASSGKETNNSVKIFTRASLNKQLLLEKPTPVKVTISRRRLKAVQGKLSKTGSATVIKDKKLRVQIKPVLNCVSNGQHTYTIDVPEQGESKKLVFSIIGTHTGDASFSIDVWQGYELAATLLFNVSVVAKKTDKATTKMRVLNNSTGNMPQAINQLRINQRETGNKTIYDYEIEFLDGIGEWRDFQSPEINAGTAKYISDLYKKIEQLHNDAAGNAKEFDKKLKMYGADLFLTLFPEDLRKLLYQNRKRLQSIQVVSNEPYIPWEILVIRHPDKSKKTQTSDPFFAELGVIRWIKRGAFPSMELKSSKSKYVIPAYHDRKRILPAAEKEISLLKEKFNAEEVKATVENVESLLRRSDFDLLHFGCHGEGENTNILGARLVMEEVKQRGNWKPTYVEQLYVEQCGSFIKNGSPQPIIVLNGCRTGLLGKKVVGYGGFAKAFLDKGAGVFVGGLWAVEDEAALKFISVFYDSLKEGKNLTQATIEARQQSKKTSKDDATWLSYVVYGNPFAKLV